jgi:SRSO17 transposase
MFEEAMARIAGRFRRVEPRATARAFLLGLLSGIERKNCWQLAEQAGHARPGPMQRLLRSARWDADAVRDDIRAYVFERLGADDGVLIVDETGFLKKGTASAGVQRQYTGTAGRIENSQVGVFLAYASSKGRALFDRRLYMPDTAWCQDTQRRTRAGVPDQTRFATKPTLAGQMVAAALDAGIDASWVTGDEAYAQDPGLRALLESRRIGYVLEDPARRWTVAELAARVGQSRATFAARFTGAVGEPPLTYLTGWRMALAADLLRDTEETVAAVAREVGYGDAFAFSVAFKRARGVSPSDWRRQVRSGWRVKS